MHKYVVLSIFVPNYLYITYYNFSENRKTAIDPGIYSHFALSSAETPDTQNVWVICILSPP